MSLEDLIAKVPPGYEWLIRSDATGKFFANISKSGIVFNVDADTTGLMFKCYADTPEEALATSLRLLKASMFQ